MAGAIPRNAELDLPHARRELPTAGAVAHVPSLRGALEGLGPHELRELPLDRLLNQRREHGPQRISWRGSTSGVLSLR